MKVVTQVEEEEKVDEENQSPLMRFKKLNLGMKADNSSKFQIVPISKNSDSSHRFSSKASDEESERMRQFKLQLSPNRVAKTILRILD